MEKNIVPPEELASEQEALAQVKEDEVRVNIINEFGFDETVDAEKIDKLVQKEIEHSKKMSQAIGQKIKWRTEANKPKDTTPPSENKVPEKPESKSSELGYAEKAFLQGNDIKGEKEFEIVKKYLGNASLDEIVDDTSVVGEIVRSQIKKMRETETTAAATPKGTKRSAESVKDNVDYWVKKPFNEVPNEMKVAVNNRKIEIAKTSNKFAPPTL